MRTALLTSTAGSLTTFLAEPETDLVERARAGDVEAVGQIYVAYAKPLYTLCFRILNQAEDAEEVLQEVFVNLHRSLNSFRSGSSFAVWLRRVTVNRAISRLRREKLRRHPSLDDEEAPQVEFGRVHGSSGVDLERALASLSPTSRTVVWLHDVEGYTHREIGEALGRTTSFSKSQLARAYRQLRQTLGDGAVVEQTS